MCHRHRERSGFLHQMISEGNVLNWGETDSACPDGGEPPITVFVVVLLNTVDEFVDLVRKAKGGVAEGRIESMMMTQPGSNRIQIVAGVTLSSLGFPGDVRVDNLDEDMLRELLRSIPPFSRSG
jgi:hypothetical protein